MPPFEDVTEYQEPKASIPDVLALIWGSVGLVMVGIVIAHLTS